MQPIKNLFQFTLFIFMIGLLCSCTSPKATAVSATFGKALSFDGSTTYVQSNFTAGALVMPYTIEFFFQPSIVSGTPSIISIQATGAGAPITFGLGISGGNISARWPLGGCQGTGGFSGNSTLVAGQKYHIALVVQDDGGGSSGTGVTLYLNGTLDGSSTTSTGSCATINALSVGADVGGTNPAAGIIDELRISSSIRYAQSFTAPTVPFATDSNTILLAHWDSSATSVDFLDSSHSIGSPTGVFPSLVASPFP